MLFFADVCVILCVLSCLLISCCLLFVLVWFAYVALFCVFVVRAVVLSLPCFV